MGAPPPESGYFFVGAENLHGDIYPSISPAQTPSLSHAGKAILITGASRGIGRATALQYAHASPSALILLARSAENLSTLESEIKKINSAIKTIPIALDVTDQTKVAAAAQQVKEQVGRLDVLINNAGASTVWKPFIESEFPAYWNLNFEVNLKGPIVVLHAFLPLLLATAKETAASTHVVNISSIGANMITPTASGYQIAKLALLRLTEFIETEYGAAGIRAVSVHPGGVPTDMILSAEDILKAVCNDTPELSGGFLVWLTSKERRWLDGRYLAATWDVDKLESMKDEIVKENKLKVRLAV